MNEKGYQSQFLEGFSYNNFRDITPLRQREWGGEEVKHLEMKKPYQYDDFKDMIYVADDVDLRETRVRTRGERTTYTKPKPQPESGSATYTPMSMFDDGTWRRNETLQYDAGVVLGNISNFTKSYIRFPRINIPQGSVITSAILTLRARRNDSTTPVNVRIYGNARDYAIAPLDAAYADSLGVTNAFVDWDGIPAWTSGTDYVVPSDLSRIIQEIVSREKWSRMGALMLFIFNNGSASDVGRAARGFEDPGTGLARLYIDYKYEPE